MSSGFYTCLVPRRKKLGMADVIPRPDDKAFGLKLKEIRKRQGVSQIDLARSLGIHQSLISQYECGYLRLHGSLIVRLAHALQTTPDEILSAEINPDSGGTLDRRFVRRLLKVNKLSRHQQKLLLGSIDAFLSKVS
jgi:transcriptional regulator with XRE-family HTH domain